MTEVLSAFAGGVAVLFAAWRMIAYHEGKMMRALADLGQDIRADIRAVNERIDAVNVRIDAVLLADRRRP